MPAAKKTKARKKAPLDRSAMKDREAAIIVDLKAGKMSYRAIAAKHGVSLPTVNAKARKAGIRRPRGRRPAALTQSAAAAPRKRGRPRKTVAEAARRPGRPRGTGRGPGRPRKAESGAFQEEFRQMLLRHFPSLTLAQYDRLTRMVTDAVR